MSVRREAEYKLQRRRIDAVEEARKRFPIKYTKLMLDKFPKYKRMFTEDTAVKLIRDTYLLRPVKHDIMLMIVKDIEALTEFLKNEIITKEQIKKGKL